MKYLSGWLINSDLRDMWDEWVNSCWLGEGGVRITELKKRERERRGG